MVLNRTRYHLCRAEAPLLAMAPHTSQLVDPLLGFIFNCYTLEPIGMTPYKNTPSLSFIPVLVE